MSFATKLFPLGLVVALSMSGILFVPIAVVLAADPPGTPKQMFQAPKDWRPTRFSDSVIFYDAPNLKPGEECRVSVFSRTEVSTFKNWFTRVQGTDAVVEESKLVEGKSKGGYETLRLTKVVRLSTGRLVYRQYLALRDGKRMALIASTASSEELLKSATKQADEMADSWDYTAVFPAERGANIVGSVVHVRLPDQDVMLFYTETNRGFTVRLEAKDGSIEGKKLYIGDGTVAADLVADPANGIFLQGVMYRQGDQFKKGSSIKLRAGYKKASDLKPGDVYVTLPGVTFELPGK